MCNFLIVNFKNNLTTPINLDQLPYRLVELGKSELRTKARDKREYAKNTMLRKTKNRSGVTETRIVTCGECGEEYCNGTLQL